MRLAGNIQSTASKTQMAAQRASAPDEPSRLRPAADEANPTPGSSAAVLGLGPDEDGEEDVEADGARRAGQRRRVPGEHAAEPLAEPVDADAPDDRREQRWLGRAAEEEADADQQFDEAEKDDPRRHLVAEEVGHVGDRRRDDRRLAGRHRPDDHVDEARAEHLRLELERAVHDPDEPQDDLDRPPVDPETGGQRRRNGRVDDGHDSPLPGWCSSVPGRAMLPPASAERPSPIGQMDRSAGRHTGRPGWINRRWKWTRGLSPLGPRPARTRALVGSEVSAQKYRVLLMIAKIAPTMISDVMAVRALWESLNVQPGPVASVVSCGSP